MFTLELFEICNMNLVSSLDLGWSTALYVNQITHLFLLNGDYTLFFLFCFYSDRPVQFGQLMMFAGPDVMLFFYTVCFRWLISACLSFCRYLSTPCPTYMRCSSSTRKSWPAATRTPASRPCLWTRPTCRSPLMPPWAFSGEGEAEICAVMVLLKSKILIMQT